MSSVEFLNELAERLRMARLGANLTQKDLAQKIGVNTNCVSMYENAKRMPSLYNMSMMSEVLDTSLDFLVPTVKPLDLTLDGQTSIYDMLGEDQCSNPCE